MMSELRAQPGDAAAGEGEPPHSRGKTVSSHALFHGRQQSWSSPQAYKVDVEVFRQSAEAQQVRDPWQEVDALRREVEQKDAEIARLRQVAVAATKKAEDQTPNDHESELRELTALVRAQAARIETLESQAVQARGHEAKIQQLEARLLAQTGVQDEPSFSQTTVMRVQADAPAGTVPTAVIATSSQLQSRPPPVPPLHGLQGSGSLNVAPAMLKAQELAAAVVSSGHGRTPAFTPRDTQQRQLPLAPCNLYRGSTPLLREPQLCSAVSSTAPEAHAYNRSATSLAILPPQAPVEAASNLSWVPSALSPRVAGRCTRTSPAINASVRGSASLLVAPGGGSSLLGLDASVPRSPAACLRAGGSMHVLAGGTAMTRQMPSKLQMPVPQSPLVASGVGGCRQGCSSAVSRGLGPPAMQATTLGTPRPQMCCSPRTATARSLSPPAPPLASAPAPTTSFQEPVAAPTTSAQPVSSRGGPLAQERVRPKRMAADG